VCATRRQAIRILPMRCIYASTPTAQDLANCSLHECSVLYDAPELAAADPDRDVDDRRSPEPGGLQP
jgi:hypothetical protein